MIIKTGYYDWNRFALDDSFYPEDIPNEWRLSFYANEFECTQLDLSNLDDVEDIDELFDDLPESFDLIITCSELGQWDLLEELINNEDVNIKAIVCEEALYQQWNESLNQRGITCFNQNEKSELSFIKDHVGQQFVNDTMSILYIDKAMNLKAMKSLVDQWVKHQLVKEGYLLLDSDVFKSSKAGELRMMIDMMGL